MNFKLIKSHLQRAQLESRNSFEEYDALWSVFNVMYEGTRPEFITKNQRPTERKMIRYCSRKLDYKEWSQLFKPEKLNSSLSIAPIFNERDWQRKAKINTREFDRLVERLLKGY